MRAPCFFFKETPTCSAMPQIYESEALLQGQPVTVQPPWVQALLPQSKMRYMALDSQKTATNKKVNTSLLMPKVLAAASAVTRGLGQAHASSLKYSNPALMLDGLLLDGEQLLTPVASSLVYGKVTITAHPSMVEVDTFESGVVVLTSERIILLSAQQYQAHNFSKTDAGSYLINSAINGNNEVYPIPRSAITGVHFRMRDSASMGEILNPKAMRQCNTWNYMVDCIGNFLPFPSLHPLKCLRCEDVQDWVHGHPIGAQHSNTRKLIVDLDLPPFGQCRMSIDFVSMDTSSAVELAKGYVQVLAKNPK